MLNAERSKKRRKAEEPLEEELAAGRPNQSGSSNRPAAPPLGADLDSPEQAVGTRDGV